MNSCRRIAIGICSVWMMIAGSVCTRAVGAEPQAPATRPVDAQTRRELGIVLLNVMEFPEPDGVDRLAQVLISIGADPNICSSRRDHAALHGLASAANLWASHGFDEWQSAATLLLAAGADINEKTYGPKADGSTPLHELIRSASDAREAPELTALVPKAAEFLLKHGADPSIRDSDGKNAIDDAMEAKDEQVKAKLLEMLKKD